MRSKVKTIMLKEIKQLIDKKFILSLIFGIIFFPFAFIQLTKNNSTESIFIGKILIIMTPSFYMFLLSFPFIQKRFFYVKIRNGFQSLLTLPITLKEILVGKIVAIMVVSYPPTILMFIILSTIYFTKTGINLIANPADLLFSLIIGPLAITTYNAMNSWIALKFGDPRIVDFLIYATAACVFLCGGILSMLPENSFSVNISSICLIVGVITIVFMLITIFLISNLKKEKVISQT
jgi:hypothetical protein